MQYDATHASVPWAGIRLILQVRLMELLMRYLAEEPEDCCQRHSETRIGGGRSCGDSRTDLSLYSHGNSVQSSGL